MVLMLAEHTSIRHHRDMKGLREASEVGRIFASSEYGRDLNGQIRWKKYKPEDMTNREWIELLGRDANNLEHMSLMHGVTVAFIRYTEEHQPDLLTDEEKELLLLVAISHDNGEAITTDISYGDKTTKNEKEEKAAYDIVVSEVFPETSDKMIGLKDVIFDHSDSKLGKMFFTIECLGYMRTALIAADVATEENTSEDLRQNLIWLVADVIGGVAVSDRLRTGSEEYVAVQDILGLYGPEIDEAYKLVNANPRVFMKYGDADKVNKKVSDFIKSKKAWKEFRSQR